VFRWARIGRTIKEGTMQRRVARLYRVLSLLICVVLSLGAAAPAAWAGRAALGPGSAGAALTSASGGAIAVSAGLGHTCALTSASGVKCWGMNFYGQLGDGTNSDRAAPVDVSGLTSGVTAIAAGGWHACALTAAGGVQCWGNNEAGQLGNGTLIHRNVPVDVTGLANAAAVAIGGMRTCALTAAGGVKCWGDGVTAPADVAGLGSGIAAVSVGPEHACALTTAGGVKCWGANGVGQLGDGTTSDRAAPVDVSGLASGVTAIAAGSANTCALTTAGGVKCWGSGGAVGDGTTVDRHTPVDVSGLSSGVTAMAAGSGMACALTRGGGVKCWGSNYRGQLGDGTIRDRSTPGGVSWLSSGVAFLEAGSGHTCAGMQDGGIRCWGNNQYGQLGSGYTFWRPHPVDVVGLGSGVTGIVAGGGHSCAVTAAGSALCWGANLAGQLGDGSQNPRYWPAAVGGLSSGVVAVSAGGQHNCALTTAGGLKCWGDNNRGQLGDATITPRPTPVSAGGLESGVAAVTAGHEHTCALLVTGGLKCWGANTTGQLGAGTNTDWWVPLDVLGLSGGVAAVSAGWKHTCAVTTAGGVKCWGDNFYGQVDPAIYGYQTLPQAVAGLGSGMAEVTAGAHHSCALTSAGGVKCWGSNELGQLGDGTMEPRRAIVDVVGLDSGVTAVSANGIHTCALMSGGGVKCWGDRITTPTDVNGLSGVSAIAAGWGHLCALMSWGGVKCWGSNADGQAGVDLGWNPVMVIGFEGWRVLAPLVGR
jgi:alpha-tubulin suppressor-like RCC1 family protein